MIFSFFFLVLSKKALFAKFYEDTDNDSIEDVCKVSCEKLNNMIERIDALDKKLDKLLAKDCKGSLKTEIKLINIATPTWKALPTSVRCAPSFCYLLLGTKPHFE